MGRLGDLTHVSPCFSGIDVLLDTVYYFPHRMLELDFRSRHEIFFIFA